MIDPKAAVSLSMALHELASNAVRFGCLSGPAGKVSIVWTFDDQGQFKLHWQEEGGPEIGPATTRGFGLRFIERQLAMEFDGSAAFEFRSSGLLCKFSLSLPPISKPLDLELAIALPSGTA